VYPLQGYGSEKGHQQDGNAYGKQKASPAPAGSLPSCCSPFAFCFLFAAVSFLQTKLKYLARKNGGLIYICKANARSLSPPADNQRIFPFLFQQQIDWAEKLVSFIYFYALSVSFYGSALWKPSTMTG